MSHAANKTSISGLFTRQVDIGARTYGYQVFVPEALAGKTDVPLIVFLHGIGQRGEGGFIPNKGVEAAFVRHFLRPLSAIVVIPQCVRTKYWHDPEMEKMVMGTLEQSTEEFAADPKRIYLIGVSMGGYGAWHLAAKHPEKFAAVVPICGGSPRTSGDRWTSLAEKIGGTPIWAFHGSDDRVVPPSESRNMVEALRKVDGNRVRYTEIEGVGHNVWLNAAADPELLPWLLRQRAE
jgi:predicted peptidase